jgi:peptidoglycan/xylan/chitin deacetylase (PgdA/CDA1 family)
MAKWGESFSGAMGDNCAQHILFTQNMYSEHQDRMNAPPAMTQVLITVDTELSALLHQRGASGAANLASSIFGVCGAGSFGIGWQMDRMEAHGLKGVFFVDPMPALVHGESLVTDIVGPIVARGHEVQLHIHTEWLQWANDAPVSDRKGGILGRFSLEDQIILLRTAADMLVRAGAVQPVAFRAGNYGADDNSLRALATLGLRWDTSVNPRYLGKACTIGLPQDQVGAVERLGVIEIPVAALFDRPGSIRPVQVCAVSSREMRAALNHAATDKQPVFVIVTHSFEMLSRDRSRPNRAVMRRFEAMCQMIAEHPDLTTAGFADLDPLALLRPASPPTRLGPNRWRTASRMAEQALATWRYERQLRPA